jgi:hypothetical protein
VLFEVGGVLGFLMLVFWIWALVDCIAARSSAVRNLPKLAWLLAVVLLLDLGALLWLVLGRPYGRRVDPALARPAETTERAPRPRRRNAPPEEPAPRPNVITDRRSAELDRRLEAWERERDLEQQFLEPPAREPGDDDPA